MSSHGFPNAACSLCDEDDFILKRIIHSLAVAFVSLPPQVLLATRQPFKCHQPESRFFEEDCLSLKRFQRDGEEAGFGRL
jgi:hypothetical protein